MYIQGKKTIQQKTQASVRNKPVQYIKDNRDQKKQVNEGTAMQTENSSRINDESGGKEPLQMKAQPAPLNNPSLPGSSGIIQLSKWKWDEGTNKWILMKGAGDDKPIFPGQYDGEIIDDKEEEEEDSTFRGKRLIGDSNELAKNRYSLGSKPVDFKKWKKNREAQHIIPATLAKKHKILESIIDNPENGIMLPATLKKGNIKITHRKPKNRDHPKYTKNVGALIDEVLKNTTLKKNQTTMGMIMDAVRPVNKLAKTYDYIDDIPYSEYKKSWNALHGTNHPI